ncbi:hypothetical protein HYH03_008441 [Edaphochlamys debaryana]|uniref:Fungal lipase-type domain-containing protein n=1 Tax=Edaphochlamys debaryana TaxID=47281 RepID=A0A835Y079_9CHLO|nr:hypothetical protein HYH03_008441 [Edaphochlamys debaryana]|eukprot:KAG2493305.1 hypothetical protein HYH03_008441 [Edaphochlamys debaryana]
MRALSAELARAALEGSQAGVAATAAVAWRRLAGPLWARWLSAARNSAGPPPEASGHSAPSPSATSGGGSGSLGADGAPRSGADGASNGGGGGRVSDVEAKLASLRAADAAVRRARSLVAARVLRALGRRHPAPASHAPHPSPTATPFASASSASPAASPFLDPPAPPLTAVLGAIAGVVRGLGGAGLGPATFGLTALARAHEEAGVVDHPKGRVLPPGPQVQAQAEQLLASLELAHGAYRRSAAALAATSCLRVQHVVVWRPEGGRLQPGYFVAVDHPGRRVVMCVRGTRAFSDLLTDLAMSGHPLGPGQAHWGMTHAAAWILAQEAGRLAALLRSLRPAGCYRLELVGHSLGGSVAALAAVMLRERLVEPARAAAIPPELVSAVAFAPAAAMSAPLAALCRPYVTSVVLGHDVVPRFDANSLGLLREELTTVDWFAELQRTLMEHTLGRAGSVNGRARGSAPGGTGNGTGNGSGVLVPAPPSTADLTNPTVPNASASWPLQQLSATLLETPAFRSAMAALDEWRSKAMASAEAQMAEAAVRRQVDLVRSWLQDLAASKLPIAAGTAGGGAGGAGGDGSGQLGDVRRAAEAAAEQLRASVDAALTGFAAAAAAGRDRLSASLPSLPQPHELPMVEPPTAPPRKRLPLASTAAAAAAGKAEQGAAAGSGGQGWARAGGAGERAAEAGGRRALELQLEGDGDAGGEADGAAAVVAEVAEVTGAGLMSPLPPGLPMLLPPGRILHIRPKWPPPSRDGAATARDGAAAAAATRAVVNAIRTGGGLDIDGGDADAADAAANGQRPTVTPYEESYKLPYVKETTYEVVELPAGTGFGRLVLRRAAFEAHQCRSYRRVLMALAQATEVPGAAGGTGGAEEFHDHQRPEDKSR